MLPYNVRVIVGGLWCCFMHKRMCFLWLLLLLYACFVLQFTTSSLCALCCWLAFILGVGESGTKLCLRLVQHHQVLDISCSCYHLEWFFKTCNRIGIACMFFICLLNSSLVQLILNQCALKPYQWHDWKFVCYYIGFGWIWSK